MLHFFDLAGLLIDEQHSQYSKLLLASKEQVLHRVVLEEKVALEQQLAEEKHTPESCFIEAAIQELKVRGCIEDAKTFSLSRHSLVKTRNAKPFHCVGGELMDTGVKLVPFHI